MRATVCRHRHVEPEVEDVRVLAPGPRDVVVRVAACGICHSDLSVIDGTYALPLPALLGHEVVGTAEWVGHEVHRVVPGDQVMMLSGPVCGECTFCNRGESHLCALNWVVSMTPRVELLSGGSAHAIAGLGGLAEMVTCDQASVVPITSDLPAEYLAIIGCGVSVGMGAVINTAQVRPGDTVAIIGCGGVGLAAIQAAHLSGAVRILAIDPKPAKRDAALRSGATDVIDPTAADAVEAVVELTSGGVDHAIEAVGAESTMNQVYGMARQGGTATIVGYGGGAAQLKTDAQSFFMGGRIFRASLGSGGRNRDFYPRLVRLAEAGRIDLSAFVTGRHALDAVNDAFDAVRRGDSIREVIVF